jgi:hypothetical protein
MTEGWRDRSACRTLRPELFFDPALAIAARDICYRCPVFSDCTAWCLPRFRDLEYGIFAGLLAEQREDIFYGERPWRDWRKDWLPGQGCSRHYTSDLYLKSGDWYCIVCQHRIEYLDRIGA